MGQRFNQIKLAVYFAVTLFAASTGLEACTGIKLTAKDGSTVQGRTLEFGIPVEITAVVTPRNYEFKAITPNGPGMVYKSKYAAVGAVAFDNIAILDGMNEKGLCVGTFYFPTFAKYTPTTPENQSKSLSPVDFPNWILTQFATLAEVKEALENVVIAPTIVKAWGNEPVPFHYIVFEKGGDALVIEPIDGKLIVHEDKLGVFTNSPTFDWHMTNLRNYINLSTYNVGEKEIAGEKFVQFGQGSGMVGLPGDYTPPSRFVRAAIFSAASTPSNNAIETVSQAFHVLNNFDIPLGVSREKTGDTYASDFTQITCVRDPSASKYYFKSYADQSIKVIDLKKFDFEAKDVKRWIVSSKQDFTDISNLLK